MEHPNVQDFQKSIDSFQFEIPEFLIVPNMLHEERIRDRAGRFIGAAVLGDDGGKVEICAVQSQVESLHDAVQKAAEGNISARNLVRANVGADVIERTIKTGHVMNPVELLISDNGKVLQHGQTMDSVQANSLRYASDHPIMRERTEAETRNAFRIEELYKKGYFEDSSFVVLSRAENLPQAGFFTETMSCSIQVTSKSSNGLRTESAFVSGITSPGKAPHDERTIVLLGDRLHVDLRGKTPAQIIDTPVLVRNDLIPNGAIDLARWFDDVNGTFFGEDRAREDYVQYLAKCRQREQTFAARVEQITDELIAEAPHIKTPVQAIERLHDLSEEHMVEHAIVDTSIDPRVFGKIAAPYIQDARLAALQGDWQRLEYNIRRAKSTAASSSCPGKLLDLANDEFDDTDRQDEKETSDEDCDFISKECPLCKKKDVKTVVTRTHISGDCGCQVKRQVKRAA